MKWIIFILLISFFVILFTVLFSPRDTLKISPKQKGSNVQTMTISSTAFENNTKIPSKYTCDGANINPPLFFEDVPKEAKSLVLIVDDPDAPSGTWHHWTIYNMDPSTHSIEENSRAKTGIEGVTDFGKEGYGGPCPPSGNHRYFFKLYALDTLLDLPEKATLNELTNAMQNHVLDEAELIGLYARSN